MGSSYALLIICIDESDKKSLYDIISWSIAQYYKKKEIQMTDKEDRLKAARDKIAKNQAEKRKDEHEERVEDAKEKAAAEARKAELQAKVKEAAEKSQHQDHAHADL